jgi:hypothetical protein
MKKKNKTFCPGWAYEKGQKILQPKHLHRSHVMDYISRLVICPVQKVPLLSRPRCPVASRDKNLLETGIIGMFSTSVCI